MKPVTRMKMIAAAFLLAAVQPAISATITFDEFPAGNHNSAVTNLYAPLGVTFGSDNSGIWSGISQGDPGNWALEGSNGSAFLGNNGFNNGSSYVSNINFSTLVSNVSFDVSRSNGSNQGQGLTASAYSGTTLLLSQSILFGAVNNWTSLVFGIGGISSLIITGTATGFSPYGLDNLQFNGNENTLISGLDGNQIDVTAVPEPETYAMMLAGLGLLAGITRRRKTQPAAA